MSQGCTLNRVVLDIGSRELAQQRPELHGLEPVPIAWRHAPRGLNSREDPHHRYQPFVCVAPFAALDRMRSAERSDKASLISAFLDPNSLSGKASQLARPEGASTGSCCGASADTKTRTTKGWAESRAAPGLSLIHI